MKSQMAFDLRLLHVPNVEHFLVLQRLSETGAWATHLRPYTIGNGTKNSVFFTNATFFFDPYSENVFLRITENILREKILISEIALLFDT